MAARVVAQEVKDLIPGCTVDDEIIEAIINDANVMITALMADCTTMSSAQLKTIEKWFAAHLVASSTDRLAASEKLGEAEVRYATNIGQGLDSTPYGQMAKSLDSCGKLGMLGKRTIRIRAIKSFED